MIIKNNNNSAGNVWTAMPAAKLRQLNSHPIIAGSSILKKNRKMSRFPTQLKSEKRQEHDRLIKKSSISRRKKERKKESCKSPSHSLGKWEPSQFSLLTQKYLHLSFSSLKMKKEPFFVRDFTWVCFFRILLQYILYERIPCHTRSPIPHMYEQLKARLSYATISYISLHWYLYFILW